MKTITIKVVTRIQDNGDGGYTTYVYNNYDELIADHPIAETEEITPEIRENILNEDDPYENGYIGEGTIKLTICGDEVILAEPLVFHGGQ